MIVRDFALALGQLGDRRFRRVLWLGVVLTLALLAGLTALCLWLIRRLLPDVLTLPWIGEITWAGDAVGWVTLAGMILLSVVLMVPVASAMTGLFLDEVADAVEARHYPQLPPARPLGILAGLGDSLRFLLILILANLIALALGLVLPIGYPALFFLMNGWLLGREYAQFAALRRMDHAAARALRRRHGAEIWLAGCLMALPLLVPVLNLFVPVLGAATFTHLVHRLQGNPAAR